MPLFFLLLHFFFVLPWNGRKKVVFICYVNYFFCKLEDQNNLRFFRAKHLFPFFYVIVSTQEEVHAKQHFFLSSKSNSGLFNISSRMEIYVKLFLEEWGTCYSQDSRKQNNKGS